MKVALFIAALAGLALVNADDADYFEISVEEIYPASHYHTGKATIESATAVLWPLHRLSFPSNKAILNTASIYAAVDASARQGASWRGILGFVPIDKDDTVCADGTKLIPVHLLHKGTDYVLATEEAEIDLYTEGKKYTKQRVDFYCSPEKGKCGASSPLIEFTSPAGTPARHAYVTTDKTVAMLNKGKWKRGKTICYIWPSQLIGGDF